MSRTGMSVLVWGIYYILAGLGFLFIPNVVLPLFGFSTTTEVWVRVVGLLVGIIGAYYSYCARNNVEPFMRITVPGRFAFVVGAIGLVMLGLSSPSILIIAAGDAIGAIWTWLSLRTTT